MSILKAGRPSNQREILDKIYDLEPLVRLSLDIPKSLSRKLKSFALENDITVKELILRSVNEYMNK